MGVAMQSLTCTTKRRRSPPMKTRFSRMVRRDSAPSMISTWCFGSRIHEARHLHQKLALPRLRGRLTLNGDVAESLCGGVVQLECRMNVHTSSAQAREEISRADTVSFVDGVEEAGAMPLSLHRLCLQRKTGKLHGAGEGMLPWCC